MTFAPCAPFRAAQCRLASHPSAGRQRSLYDSRAGGSPPARFGQVPHSGASAFGFGASAPHFFTTYTEF